MTMIGETLTKQPMHLFALADASQFSWAYFCTWIVCSTKLPPSFLFRIVSFFIHHIQNGQMSMAFLNEKNKFVEFIEMKTEFEFILFRRRLFNSVFPFVYHSASNKWESAAITMATKPIRHEFTTILLYGKLQIIHMKRSTSISFIQKRSIWKSANVNKRTE